MIPSSRIFGPLAAIGFALSITWQEWTRRLACRVKRPLKWHSGERYLLTLNLFKSRRSPPRIQGDKRTVARRRSENKLRISTILTLLPHNHLASHHRLSGCYFQASHCGIYYIYYLPHTDLGNQRPALGQMVEYRAPQVRRALAEPDRHRTPVKARSATAPKCPARMIRPEGPFAIRASKRARWVSSAVRNRANGLTPVSGHSLPKIGQNLHNPKSRSALPYAIRSRSPVLTGNWSRNARAWAMEA